MGVVYRAQDPAIGRTIAIKTIRLSDLTDPSERERLRDRLFREAQSAGILSHPNIVTIYDILEEGGLAYIFMEYVNGAPLEKLLSSEEQPDKNTVLGILRQTAGALDYAHRKGIVHRDIKPANIMMHDDGIAKITDFGVAKIVSQQMTQSGTMMGTPSYMSPEQVQGGEVTGRADQFALAVIAYEFLTGEKPFTGEYLPSLLYKICREDPAPPQRLNPTLDGQLDAVFRRALAKAPHDRYATCSDFVTDLQRACALRPDWSPMARGASQNMETVATVLAAENGNVAAFDGAETVAGVPSPAVTPIAPPAPVVESRQPPRLEESESHTVRNVLLAVAAGVVIVAGILATWNWATPSKPQIAESVPAAPVPEAAKPSPAGAAQPVPPPIPAAEPPRETQPANAEAGKTAPARTEPEPVAVPTVRPESPSLPARTPQGMDVIVRIITSPPGAHVVVDGNAQLGCTAPCSLPLPAGRHRLVAKADGYRDANRFFEVPRDADLSVDMERRMGTLSVTSTPPGATILLNGQVQAEKTPAILKVPAGSYRLQVVNGSLKSDEVVVEIADGAVSQQRYTLQ